MFSSIGLDKYNPFESFEFFLIKFGFIKMVRTPLCSHLNIKVCTRPELNTVLCTCSATTPNQTNKPHQPDLSPEHVDV